MLMVELENVSKYYGSTQALKEVSCSIKKGEIIGFLGPNGAGKSTAMKIIVEPSSAVPLAALMASGELQGARIGIILSGGNVDFGQFFDEFLGAAQRTPES